MAAIVMVDGDDPDDGSWQEEGRRMLEKVVPSTFRSTGYSHRSRKRFAPPESNQVMTFERRGSNTAQVRPINGKWF